MKYKAETMNINILSLEIRPDHVHIYVNCHPKIAPYQIIYRFKEYTARHLRKEFPELMKLPSMWTTAYLVSTENNIGRDTIKKYISMQSKY